MGLSFYRSINRNAPDPPKLPKLTKLTKTASETRMLLSMFFITKSRELLQNSVTVCYYRKTTVVSKGFDLPITKDSCPLVRAGEFTPRRVESGRFTRKVLACGGSAAICVNSESNCIFCWHILICLITGGARACEAFLKPQRHPLLVLGVE